MSNQNDLTCWKIFDRSSKKNGKKIYTFNRDRGNFHYTGPNHPEIVSALVTIQKIIRGILVTVS